MSEKPNYDVIIIGAGAAGLMCAIEAGKKGKRVWLIDHAKKTAEKIRISGGGRCNFTNIYTMPTTFLSDNKHFCKSALKQYTQDDFISLVNRHAIKHHEKKFGQLFCDEKSQLIIDMLLTEIKEAGVKLDMETEVTSIKHKDDTYTIKTNRGEYECKSLVIATGGLSIPKIGATGFGYKVAQQFGLKVNPTRAGLVPLTFTDDILNRCKELSGLSVEATVTAENGKSFAEGLLFTHRGLSGPSILQISSYWNEGETLTINLAPEHDVFEELKSKKNTNPKQEIHNALSEYVPKRLALSICEHEMIDGNLAELSHEVLKQISDAVNHWIVKPNGTEGYRTAEVTLGGVNTDEISSKTMESHKQKRLFFIGEVIDVTGHLGGFNFQWAWSSGYVAGQNV